MTDFASGSVFYEVELMLSSDSGRAKHVDLDEQGGWLVEVIRQHIDIEGLEGIAFGRLRYWGQNCAPTADDPVLDVQIHRS